MFVAVFQAGASTIRAGGRIGVAQVDNFGLLTLNSIVNFVPHRMETTSKNLLTAEDLFCK